MPAPAMPDAKQMAVELLDAALSGVHVAGRTPPDPQFRQLLPMVRVLRVGGLRALKAWGGPASRDDARLSVDCYAPTDGEATRLALRVLDEWELLPGRTTEDGSVTKAWQEIGPQDRPEEPNTSVARIGMILGMSVRPPRLTS
ncbi:hypothetical protein [Streptomyces sp. H27-D2]|uniref:hypothetical protein n=1 Tax=Streptomyces sp. H27-D2 TaxID=3046304 RepID=UPI002DB62B44|nr:hypothetical protein [Streptomyces sp. H27-D2]MEC4016098.1 hypothetical protein [Streptomyces sp. H27-D2]